MYKTFLSLLILTCITQYTTNAAKCLIDKDEWCIFSKISTTELFTQFYPSAEAPSNVEKIKFQNSRLHTLTNKICERFSNLEELDLSSVLLKKIDSDAFYQCKKLKWLDLSSNHLTEIDPNIFTNNKNLESMDLHGNFLKKMNLLFMVGLTRLVFLDVSRNHLQSFSVYNSPKLTLLRDLYLQNNELTELNEQAIVQKLPNLEKLKIGGNLLHCKRLEEMILLFEEYGIEIMEGTLNGNLKNADCLSENQWTRLPCVNRFAAIRDEWMWLKKQINFAEEDTQEEE